MVIGALIFSPFPFKQEINTLTDNQPIQAPEALVQIAKGAVSISSFPDLTKNPIWVAEQDKVAAEIAVAAQKAEEDRVAQEAYQASLIVYTAPTTPTPLYSADNSYSYGYCTWYVKEQKPYLPNLMGNANNWGYVLGFDNNASVGAIAWTTRGSAGHVGIVAQVGGGRVLISEMNAVGWGVIDTTWYPVSDFQYIHK